MTTQLSNRRDLDADHPLETLPHPPADLMIRSRSMLLIHENLAKARIRQRLDEAQLVRQSRLARAARLRQAQSSKVASAASRARLLVAFGSASR